MALPDVDQPVPDEVLADSSILRMLARIKEMNQTGAWFRPRTIPEINDLIPQIWEIARGLFAANCLGAFRVAGDSWQEALNKATAASQVPRPTDWKVIYDLAHSTAEGPAAEAAQKVFGSPLPGHIIELAAREAGFATACLTETGYLSGKKVNPHSIIWTLFEMGATGVCFLPDVRRKLTEGAPSLALPPAEMLRIHMPVTFRHPVPNVDLTYLVCLVSDQNGEGDSEVHYLHSVANHEGCPKIRLFNPAEPILV